jgi:hypothetical protein
MANFPKKLGAATNHPSLGISSSDAKLVWAF